MQSCRARNGLVGTLALTGLLFLTPPARGATEPVGAEPSQPPTAPYALRNTSTWFLAGETLGAILVFAAYSAAAGDPATSCGWCETNSFDRGVRDFLVTDDKRLAATWSHVLSLGLTPGVAFVGALGPSFMAGKPRYALEDAWIMLNTFVLVTGLTDGTKKTADRQRPAFSYGVQSETEASNLPVEEYLSFYSGDTAWAFTFASSATTLAYLRGYKSAPYIAGIAGGFALAAGLLRISADMHWATDVLTGATVGTATGFLVPFLLHRRVSGSHTTVVPFRSGLALTGTF